MRPLPFFTLAFFLLFTACQNEGSANSESQKSALENPDNNGPQDPTAEPNNRPNKDPIVWIKTEFQRIEKNTSKFEHIKVEYEEEPFGGMYEAWFEDGKLVKLRDDVYNEHGPYALDYYFHEEQPFFLFQNVEFVEMVEKGNHNITQNRYYIYQGELVSHLVKEATFAWNQKADLGSVKNVEQLDGTIDGKAAGKEKVALIREVVERFEAVRGD